MHRYQRELFYKHSANKDFLLSKTDAKPAGTKPENKTSIYVEKELLEVFPAMRCGKLFIEHGLDRLAQATFFGSLAIRIDAVNTHTHGLDTDRICSNHKEVARAVDKLCELERGIWGLIGLNLFGCFFPEKDDIACRILAQKLKKNLYQQCNKTVSIGVAVYPTIDFKRDQIFVNARKALDHAAFFGPDSMISFDAVSLNISGDMAYDKGHIDDAAEEFKTALRLDPSNVNIRNSLGVCYGVQGHLDKALQEFQKAVSLDPREVMAVYNAGIVNMMMGNKTEALEYLLKAGRIDGEIFEVTLQTGRIYLDLKEPQKAKNYIEKAVKLRPTSGPAFSVLGECYVAMELKQKAVAAYKKAVKQNSNDAAALSALGWLLADQGENLEIALLFCKQSVDIAPENGLFRHRLGRLYLKENRLEDAHTQFKEAAKLGYDSRQFIAQIENKHVSKAS
jgi:tetratricopeptide (TPR) repeat protein